MSGVPKFTIRCDRSTGVFLPTIMHAVLSAPDPDGGEALVPMEVVDIDFPQDIVSIQPQGAEAPGSLVQLFEVSILDSALQKAGFAKSVAKPLEVVFRARPVVPAGSTQEAPEVEQRAQIVIEAATTIHWRDEEDANSTDAPLYLDADGLSVLRLHVWCERYDATEQRIVTDDTVIFSHWTYDKAQDVGFVICDDVLPMLDPTSRRDHTRWCTKTALPSDTFPDAEPPIDTGIRVKAWEAGTVTRAEGKIFNPSDASPLVIAQIPVTLEAVKATAQLLDPVRPVPANAQPVPLRVRIVNERTKQPVENGTYQFELATTTGCGSRLGLANGGVASTATLTLGPKNEGVVDLEFVPPELVYQPGTVYAETLRITRGSGAKTVDVATLQIFLTPRLEATITAKKPGLDFESRTLNFVAGSVPHAFTGTLSFEIVNADPSETATADIAGAEIEITCGTATQSIGRLETGKDGSFRWELTELKPGLLAAKLPLLEHDLEVDDLPLAAFDSETALVIDDYDAKIKAYAPTHLYHEALKKEVLTHRLEFGTNIATYAPSDLRRIIAGTQLYRTGITYGRTYEQMSKSITQSAKEQLGGIFKECIALSVTLFKVGEKLTRAGAGIISWLGKATSGVVKRFFTFAATTLAGGLQKAAQGMLTWLQSMSGRALTPNLKRSVGLLESAWSKIVGALASLRSAFSSSSTGIAAKSKDALSKLRSLILGLLKTLASIMKTLAETLWTATILALQKLGTKFAGAADSAGKFLTSLGIPNVDRFGDHIRRTFAHYLPAGSATGAGLTKIVELQFLGLLDAIGVFPAAGSATGASIASRLSGFGDIARTSVGFLGNDVARVRQVPADADPNIDRFRDTATLLGERVRATTTKAAELEETMAGIDVAVLFIEILIASATAIALATGTVATGGLAAVAAATTMAEVLTLLTHIEFGVGALKLLYIRVPAIAYTLLENLRVGSVYGTASCFLANSRQVAP